MNSIEDLSEGSHMYHPTSRKNSIRRTILIATAVLLGLVPMATRAQSTQIEYPTPVGSNEIAGSISPMDIGDPRLTHFYYVFTGTQGDLIVKLESKNLNGDMDIFTASGLRPLLKISMYATESTSTASKTVFLHLRQQLILRIEARTPNDDPGEYKISFGGGFEPSQELAEDRNGNRSDDAGATRGKGTRRVTSVGATIEEPKAEPEPAAVADIPDEKTKSKEIAKPSAETTQDSVSGDDKSRKSKSPSPKPPARRAARGRSPANGSRSERTRPGTESAKTTEPKPTEKTVKAKPTPPAKAAKQDIPVPPSAKLIVELKDGTRIEQSMGTIRRVTIDNGQIVIIHNTGRIERVPMANVLRMAVEP